MQLLGHRVAGGGAELGVLGQYLDGELHLVDDSLSGAVVRTEQFEVADIVVQTISVNMVHGLFGAKLASDMLFHIVAVLKDFVHGVAVSGRNTQYGVVSFDAPGYFRKSVTFAVQLARPFVFALLAAKFLFSVNRARSVAASFVEFFVAVFAYGFVLFVRSFSPPDSRADHRAVLRELAKFFLVSGDVGANHRKWMGTFPACKFDGSDSRSDSSVFDLMGFSTRRAAILAGSFSFASDAKNSVAVFASSFNRHGNFSLVGCLGK